jgi:hypothetical protein
MVGAALEAGHDVEEFEDLYGKLWDLIQPMAAPAM